MQDKKNIYSLEGKILVASPNLEDKFFEKAIVYIFMHDENGAVGVIINHKIGTITSKELMKMVNKKSKQKIDKANLPIVFGGPVYTQSIIALSLSESSSKDIISMDREKKQYVTLYTNIQAFTQDLMKEEKITDFLLVRGISAWDKNQLEEEISNNDWFVVSPDMKIIFSNKMEDKWEKLINKLGLKDGRYIVSYNGHA